MTLQQFLCKYIGHKWGAKYPTAGADWCHGMGHHAQNCQRPGCTWIKRHWPS